MVRPTALLALLLALAAIRGGLSQNCGSSCLECTADGTFCTECDPLPWIFLDEVAGTCGETCPSGTFMNNEYRTCPACATGCSACNSGDAGACTACSSGFVLNAGAGTCVCTCPGGKYGDMTSFTCQACATGCSACTSGDAGACTACSSGFVLNAGAGTCVCTCPGGKYGDMTSFTCQACATGCSACTSGDAGACTACSSGFVLNAGAGTCDVAPVCPTGCTACSDANTCTACDTGYWKDGGACAASCPPATYLAAGKICKPCNPRCTTCTGELWSDCTACAAPFYLSGTTCGTTCPPGKYPDDATRTCATCPTGCKTCSSANTCTSCESGYWRTADLKCVLPADCPSGTFAHTNPNNRICAPCTAPCATCSAWGPNACATCAAPNFLSGTTCVSTCPWGQHGDTTTRTCVACTAGFWATATGCVDTCPAGSFKSPSTWAANARCIKCPEACATCTTSSACRTCKNGGTPNSKGVCPNARRSLLAWVATA
ncbi:pro convertase subtilisin kexin type 5-like [Raphidocelis subcapitata]|uniref:Pro convertase subtilisin kexin type 5-like n=1 Tax=Raphidocelis subcapitata TaxID=307507 RepID=A0A2V0PKY7_9CHLO|nr:pro convertase subtilisin kexin type 5-like [Raphidocelis subcapitata]|eukprot:GBG00465.1 pro convertase subtilisin kexin type 5-like [Raphidocelis subcapitata]